MALILSLETSTNVCSVALHKDGELIAISEVFLQKSHSQMLTIISQEVVSRAGFEFSDLEAFAVSAGPGSYTGLRIGTSTVKGFCFSLDKPMIAIDTLEGMVASVNAYNLSESYLCPMIDARRMEVYCLIADANNNVLVPTHSHILKEESFESYLRDKDVIFFGNGSDKSRTVLSKYKNARFISGVNPSARGIGKLAEKAYNDGKFEDVIYFEPNYLKDFVSTGIN